jgi:hypothetical protein
MFSAFDIVAADNSLDFKCTVAMQGDLNCSGHLFCGGGA